MANKIRPNNSIRNEATGEAQLTKPDGGSVFMLFTEEAILVAEANGVNVPDLIPAIARGAVPSYTVQRILIWAGINAWRTRHEGKQITPETAGRIIKASGGWTAVLPILLESLTLSGEMGEPLEEDDIEDGDDEEAEPEDPKAEGGDASV